MLYRTAFGVLLGVLFLNTGCSHTYSAQSSSDQKVIARFAAVYKAHIQYVDGTRAVGYRLQVDGDSTYWFADREGTQRIIHPNTALKRIYLVDRGRGIFDGLAAGAAVGAGTTAVLIAQADSGYGAIGAMSIGAVTSIFSTSLGLVIGLVVGSRHILVY